MTELFTKEKINSGRQKELDIAKGLAILFMILVHINEVYVHPSLETSMYSKIIEFIGSPPAAPIFMFLLGLGIVYSKRSNPKYLIKRGILIFLLAYALNFFRDFIPFNLLSILDSDPSYKEEAISSLFGIDILPFAGLTFLFFGIVKKLKFKDSHIAITWCIFETLNLFLRDNSTGMIVTDRIFGVLWGTNDYSWFPFLSWIAFPIFGYFFGKLLIRCKNKQLFYKKCFIISLVALVPLVIYAYINGVEFGAFGDELYQETYYHHDIMGNIILGTFSVFWISIIYFITNYIPEKIYIHFARWSKNITKMYCVHWILLGYSMLLFELESYMPIKILGLFIVIFIITDIICTKLSKIKKKSAIKTNPSAAY
ncbi:heparan-alpha-glucosaminide N-acetyltransferase domain-containing protein [Clostridium weizhouense]|uniref:DUF1624 domain-containing protein n=1 Tax=Clostridium weizhouense TaxID=2859781 RepID=A0ABS7ARL8_9CLOT|nr:heparan-alpha-glucosaminide N-acetyltransferase domain-containing protein [Clostridium weizhouense]MBW6411267.1 DUF1624 domain-containing protein [Clostridium weizhouense]